MNQPRKVLTNSQNNGSSSSNNNSVDRPSETPIGTQNNNNNNNNKNNHNEHNHEMNESKEHDVNLILTKYINTVKELSEGIKTNSNHSSASVLLAMRGLEKDLDMLAKVYENQFVQMRTEMNALAATRNKYSLDNFNLEVKIKDLTHKFDEVKRSNEELIGELNAAKANSNRLMYELDKAKLDAEKTQREKRQLKKDFDELSDQLDEKQKILDDEIRYRQEVEAKNGELADLAAFEKKLHDQETENLKTQLASAQEIIRSLELRASSSMSTRNEAHEKTIHELRKENANMREKCARLEQQNETLKNDCRRLENVIMTLEEIKGSFEESLISSKQEVLMSKSLLNSNLKKSTTTTTTTTTNNSNNNNNNKQQQDEADGDKTTGVADASHHFNGDEPHTSTIIHQPLHQTQAARSSPNLVVPIVDSNIINASSSANVNNNSNNNTNSTTNGNHQVNISFAPRLSFSDQPLVRGHQLTTMSIRNAPLSASSANITNRTAQPQPRSAQSATLSVAKAALSASYLPAASAPIAPANSFIQMSKEQLESDKEQHKLVEMRKQMLVNENSYSQRSNPPSFGNMFSPSSSIFSAPNNKPQTANGGHTNQHNGYHMMNGVGIGSGKSNSNGATNGPGQVRDFTKDLFNEFERATLFQPASGYSKTTNPGSMLPPGSVDNNITEASYTGNVKIHEVNKNGYYVRLLNVSNTVDEDLSFYTIQQTVCMMPVAIFRLPAYTKLQPGHTLTVWSRSDEIEPQPPHTFVWNEQEKWGTGPECTTILSKPNGQAVSWTTGSHKYGNIALKDFDEILPLYAQKKNNTKQAAQLNRQKLAPNTIFSPTKHPHGFGAKTNTSSEAVAATTTGTGASLSFEPTNIYNISMEPAMNCSPKMSESLFATQRSRPVNSASSSKNSARAKGLANKLEQTNDSDAAIVAAFAASKAHAEKQQQQQQQQQQLKERDVDVQPTIYHENFFYMRNKNVI